MTTEIKTRISTDIEETPPIRTEMSITTQPPTSRHLETIRLTKRLAISDADGRTIYDTGEIPSHSFVVAFIRALWGCFTRTNQHSTDINGTWQPLIRWASTGAIMMLIDGGPGDINRGPVVGMGTAALSNFDHRLDIRIAHGTGTNQLLYGSTSLIGPVELAGALLITIQRTYVNHSTAPVSVSECGIYCIGNEWPAPRHHCIIRDLVSPAISLPLGHTLLLEYRIQTRV